jgi:phosphoribosylamine-glycine ligase
MQRHGIPTANYQTFSDVAQAHAYVDANGAPSSSRPTAWLPAKAWWLP